MILKQIFKRASLTKTLKLGTLLTLTAGIYTNAIGASLTPITQQKVNAGTPVTVMFLGDSNTAGCGTADSSGDSTFPAVFASLLASQMPPQIGVNRIDQVSTPASGTDLKGLCRAFAKKQTTLKTGLFGSHQIIRSGFSGNTATDISISLNDAFANSPKVDLVVLMVGINESIMKFDNGAGAFKAIPADGYATNDFKTTLMSLVQNIKNKGIGEILLVSSFSNGYLQTIGSAYPQTNAICFAATSPIALGSACSLYLYNEVVKSVGNSSGSNVHFLDINNNLMTALGASNNISLANSHVQANISKWTFDMYHPNDLGYKAIGDQIFYNTLNIKSASPPPAISSAGVTTAGYGWAYSSNITPSLRANVTYDSSDGTATWTALATPTISADGTWLSFTLSGTTPQDCKDAKTCTAYVSLKDLISGQTSNQLKIVIPK